MNRCTIYCQVVISAMRKNEWEKESGGRGMLFYKRVKREDAEMD